MSEGAVEAAAPLVATQHKRKQRTMFCPSQRAKDESERFSISAEQYLAKHHIRDYVEDVTKLLLECRDENPLSYLHRYFKCCSDGTNVLLREFEYINATPRNRHAFVVMFRSAYSNFDDGHMVSLSDYHQLLLLLCPDFPGWLVHKAYDAVVPRDVGEKEGMDTHRMAFSELKRYVELFFVFSEYLDNVRMTFKVLANGSSNDAVELRSLLWSIKQLSAQNDFSCPDMSLLDELVTVPNARAVLDAHDRLKSADSCYAAITYLQFVYLLTQFSLLDGPPERKGRSHKLAPPGVITS